MFARDLAVDVLNEVLQHGEAIEMYPDDKPYPSSLLLGEVHGRTLHVVAARDPETKRCVVITAYVPDGSAWEPNFRIRRKK